MQRLRKNFETRRGAHEGCENAFDSWVAESDPVKRAQIQTIRSSLARDYEEAEVLEEASRLERDSLQAELKEREAYFSQCEILRFIQSKRCEFTPMNVARAMGGLPFVTARMSFIQCAKYGVDPRPGMAYEIFQIIEGLFRRPMDDLAKSIDSMREFLLKPRKDPPAHVAELRRNWYYLESAIRFTARDTRAPLDSIPFRLFAEYTRIVTSQGAADSVLADAKRLVVPAEYKAPQSGPDWGPPRKHPTGS